MLSSTPMTVITGPLRALYRHLEHRIVLGPEEIPEGPGDPGPTDPWPRCPVCSDPGMTVFHDTPVAPI